MRRLPASAEAYKKTPVFTENSIPAGLLREHSTKAGVWGLIHVLSGALQLSFVDGAPSDRLVPGQPGVIAPQEPHRVAADGPVQFFVEFYRVPAP
ncbi:MAG: DUF1971 domain-containing protein [Thalassobaculum sp.]